jgi:hypothetical protein
MWASVTTNNQRGHSHLKNVVFAVNAVPAVPEHDGGTERARRRRRGEADVSHGVTARELLELRGNRDVMSANELERWLLESGFAEPNGEPHRFVSPLCVREHVAPVVLVARRRRGHLRRCCGFQR